jgi:hypothetical protein
MTAATARRSSRAPVLIGAALVVVLVLIALLAGDSDSTSRGPALSPSSTAGDGTRGLVLLLGELGADVRVGDRLPSSQTRIALLLHDGLSSEDHTQLRNWVSDGGTLIVSDPSSTLSAPRATKESVALVGRGTCTMPELADVERINAGFTPILRTRGETASCFGDRETAFVTSATHGHGRIVSIADPGIFTNEALDDADNSVLAARLLVPTAGSAVALLDPNQPGSGRTTLLDLVSDRVFQAILQVGVAFILYALWRARRVGAPVTERQPVAIAGSQFVRAVGGLHLRTHAADRAAATLRLETRRAVCERYGIPLYTDVDSLATVTAAHTALDRATVAAALGDTPILDEESLVTLGHSLDSIRQEVLDGRSR